MVSAPPFDASRLSPLELAAALYPIAGDEVLGILAGRDDGWALSRRPEQSPDWHLPWTFRLWLAGRGGGKTRSGAEAVDEFARLNPRIPSLVVGRTSRETRAIQIEGESGILAIATEAGQRPPKYEPSLRRIVWDNGHIAEVREAAEPDGLRGGEWGLAWADELAAWPYLDRGEQSPWSILTMGLRAGGSIRRRSRRRQENAPRLLVTTTPRPKTAIRDLIADPRTHVSAWSSYANAANLPIEFITDIIKPLEGTRISRQEIYAQLLEDVPGALWTWGMIDDNRAPAPSKFDRIVTAVDPAVTSKDTSDMTGIATAGVVGTGDAAQVHVLNILQGQWRPSKWAQLALHEYDRWESGSLIAEVNNGGDLVAETIRQQRPGFIVKQTRARVNKASRAEPISQLYERGRVHHTAVFGEIEDEMVRFPVAHTYDDGIDALVYAVTALALRREIKFYGG